MPKKSTASTRRRGDTLEDALLDAAWAELAARGYASLSMDAVAARAQTSKTVLYRRWSCRAELVLAALRRHAPIASRVPDTGSLRDDLVLILKTMSRRYRAFPDIVRGLMIELPDSDAVVAQTLGETVRIVFERAIARGEAVAARVTPRVIELPLDLARYRMFVDKAPLAKKDIEGIVDEIVLPLAGG